MLKNNFYTLTSEIPKNESAFRVTIRLNASHDIFKGHFPGLPVTPGVCMLGIVKELLEASLGKTLTLHEASNIKFLSLIDPNQFPEIDVEVKHQRNDDGSYTADGTIFTGGNACFKISKAHYR
ncbi:MAG: 3-hydroxyacyl-ACP dehydratase [Bacteroidetes bacterium]|nr:3-hydroxyacyl-ACP dehydratase [Bacteroidota bacterium]